MTNFLLRLFHLPDLKGGLFSCDVPNRIDLLKWDGGSNYLYIVSSLILFLHSKVFGCHMNGVVTFRIEF